MITRRKLVALSAMSAIATCATNWRVPADGVEHLLVKLADVRPAAELMDWAASSARDCRRNGASRLG
jgi:hypothetical protein